MHRRARGSLPAVAAIVMAAVWATAVFARTGADVLEAAAGDTRVGGQAPQPATARVQAAPAKQPPASAPGQKDSPPPGAAGAQLVGDDTCLTCHEAQKNGYANTLHGRPDHPRSPAARQGCETCHGAGSRHVDDPEVPGMIRAFAKDAPREANATCLTCHTRGAHALWEGSAHESRNLSCVTCHSVHAFKSEGAQLKTVREMDTCATCHRDKAAKVDRSGHMPLREGKMQCSTCHNPHGATNVRALRKGESIGGPVYLLPRRQARPLSVGARPDARRLHDLSRPARVVQRADARRQDADHVPALPRDDAPPEHDLRLRPDRLRRYPERAHLRAGVRHLPLDDSRIQPSERPALHPVRGRHMRIPRVLAIVTLALLPMAAAAQTAPPAAPVDQPPVTPPAASQPGPADAVPDSASAERWTGSFDFGVRGSDVEGDRSRYERYRDLGDGLFLETVRLNREHEGLLLDFQAEHVGRRDQRYIGEVTRPGRFTGRFMWDQIPMFLSGETRTLFAGVGSGELTIDDGIQASGQALPASITDIFKQSSIQFATRTRRHIADGAFEYAASEALTFQGSVRRTNRAGTVPFGGSFGHSSLVELPAPTEHNLSEVDGSAEYVRDPYLVRAGYTGSWFHNDVTSVVFDNPFRLTDTAAAPSRGRLTLSPSNSFIGVNGLGSIKLPGRTRLTAHASIGTLKDAGEPLVPQTINAAISPAPLARSTVEGEARVSSMNVNLVARPVRAIDVTLRYRSYDFNNRTPEFLLARAGVLRQHAGAAVPANPRGAVQPRAPCRRCRRQVAAARTHVRGGWLHPAG